MPYCFKRKILPLLLALIILTTTFHNVSAELITYTVDDDGSNITISENQEFNISFENAELEWTIDSYDASIIELIGGETWFFSENPGSHFLLNFTFKGQSPGTTSLIVNHHKYWEYPNQPIDGNFTLNVTVVGQESVNITLIIMVVVLIGVVPAAIIIYKVKGEEKHEK